MRAAQRAWAQPTSEKQDSRPGAGNALGCPTGQTTRGPDQRHKTQLNTFPWLPSLHTGRLGASHLCQAPPPWTLTDTALRTCAKPPQAETEPAPPRTCARPRLFKHQQTQPLVPVPSSPPWTLIDQHLTRAPGCASWDTPDTCARHLQTLTGPLCGPTFSDIDRPSASYRCLAHLLGY